MSWKSGAFRYTSLFDVSAVVPYICRQTSAQSVATVVLLWAPAQRKRATMLYFANVFFIYFFYGRLILLPWLTEVRENFTRGGP